MEITGLIMLLSAWGFSIWAGMTDFPAYPGAVAAVVTVAVVGFILSIAGLMRDL